MKDSAPSPVADFPARLRALMRRKSAEAVACAIGVAPSTMRSWKAGKTQPKLSDLIRLAEYFHVSVEFLARGGDIATDSYRRPHTGSGVDVELLTQLMKGITSVCDWHDVQLPSDRIAEVTASWYRHVVTASDDPVERRGAIKLALTQIEKELLSPNDGMGPKSSIGNPRMFRPTGNGTSQTDD